MVASSLLKGRGWRARVASHGWLWVAVLVGGGLVGTALLSPDRQQQLQDHVASGPLRDIAEAQVLRVLVRQGERQWQLQRQAAGWIISPARDLPAVTLNAQVEGAVRLLRNAAVERELAADSPDYGLASPRAVQVRVFTSLAADAAPAWTFDFGGLNPVGLARYARLQAAGAPAQVVLLPSYVAEAWEQAVGLR